METSCELLLNGLFIFKLPLYHEMELRYSNNRVCKIKGFDKPQFFAILYKANIRNLLKLSLIEISTITQDTHTLYRSFLIHPLFVRFQLQYLITLLVILN